MIHVSHSLLILTAGFLGLAASAARGESAVPFETAISLSATAAPNTGNSYCGGSASASLTAEAHGNGYSSLGPVAFFLQKTLDLPGSMHGCVTFNTPNGDTLTATYDGTADMPNSNGFANATGTLTFTGGTGRFRNASGAANFSCIFFGIYPASSFFGGTSSPLVVSAFYTIQGRLVFHGGD